MRTTNITIILALILINTLTWARDKETAVLDSLHYQIVYEPTGEIIKGDSVYRAYILFDEVKDIEIDKIIVKEIQSTSKALKEIEGTKLKIKEQTGRRAIEITNSRELDLSRGFKVKDKNGKEYIAWRGKKGDYQGKDFMGRDPKKISRKRQVENKDTTMTDSERRIYEEELKEWEEYKRKKQEEEEQQNQLNENLQTRTR